MESSMESAISSVSTVLEVSTAEELGKDRVDPFLVQLDLLDPVRAQNWPLGKKLYATLLASLLSLNGTLATSLPVGIADSLIKEFKISNEVATLTMSIFVCGYCVGPIIWGPLSERYGRKVVYMCPTFLFTGTLIGSALSNNIALLLIFRFFGGFFGVASLTIAGGYVSDMWDEKVVGNALACITIMPFGGPTLSPILSGYVQVSGINWRWAFWILSIVAGITCVLMILTLEESYEPFLALKKAQKKRKDTGDGRYYALLEKGDDITFMERVKNILLKPIIILIHEPMLISMTAYTSFIYGCLYLNFESYSTVFIGGYKMNAGQTALMYIPIFVGGALSMTVYVFYYNRKYIEQVEAYAPRRVPPEIRLDVALWLGPFFSLSVFLFGWTSYPWISHWVCMMSGVIFGYAYLMLYQGMFNYTVDAYVEVAASATAISTVSRSVIGAIFPLFATQMFQSLNPRWGSTTLGFISLLGIPIPFVLKKYGPKLRMKSRYAPALDIASITEKDGPA